MIDLAIINDDARAWFILGIHDFRQFGEQYPKAKFCLEKAISEGHVQAMLTLTWNIKQGKFANHFKKEKWRILLKNMEKKLIELRENGCEEPGIFSFDDFDFKRDAFLGHDWAMRNYAISLGDNNPKAWYWKKLSGRFNAIDIKKKTLENEDIAFQIGAALSQLPSGFHWSEDKMCLDVYKNTTEERRISIVAWILCAKTLQIDKNIRKLISMEIWKDMIIETPYLFDPLY